MGVKIKSKEHDGENKAYKGLRYNTSSDHGHEAAEGSKDVKVAEDAVNNEEFPPEVAH